MVLNIQRQPGTNIIGVVDRVKDVLPRLQASLPSSIHVDILTDRTNTIRASVKDVQFELMLTIALVVMVIFLFLRSVAATIIPSVAVPLSIVGTFAAMYLLGYSLDNLSLMALTISTGFVVDDAIVMIENISRYIEEGYPPMEAALSRCRTDRIHDRFADRFADGRADSTSLHGRHYRAAVPGICRHAGRYDFCVRFRFSHVDTHDVREAPASRRRSRSKRASIGCRNDFSSERSSLYGKGVQFVLRHQTATLLVTAGTFVLTLFLAYYVPKGFFPVQDTGVILGVSDAPETVSFTAMAERQQALAAVILKDPDVVSLSSFIGVDGTNMTPNSGRIQINLKPREDREASASDIIRRLQPQLAKVDGITLFMQPVQDITVEDRVSRTQYQYSIEDADPAELSQWAPRVVDKFKSLPQLRDVATDQLDGGLQANLVIDRDTASRLGVLPQAIDDTLYDAFGQRLVSIIFTQLNQYHVVMEVDPKYQQNPDALKSIYVQSSSGTTGAA